MLVRLLFKNNIEYDDVLSVRKYRIYLIDSISLVTTFLVAVFILFNGYTWTNKEYGSIVFIVGLSLFHFMQIRIEPLK